MTQRIRKSRGGFHPRRNHDRGGHHRPAGGDCRPRGFLRSRKRSQATAILNDARVIDGSIDQYAIENNVIGSTSVQKSLLRGFFKPNSRLYNQAGTSGILTDILGNAYAVSTLDSGVKINTATESNFTDVITVGSSFWGAYFQ